MALEWLFIAFDCVEEIEFSLDSCAFAFVLVCVYRSDESHCGDLPQSAAHTVAVPRASAEQAPKVRCTLRHASNALIPVFRIRWCLFHPGSRAWSVIHSRNVSEAKIAGHGQ